MSNILDPDQAQQIVGPDLGPKGLHRLSADDTSSQITEPNEQIVFLPQIIEKHLIKISYT